MEGGSMVLDGAFFSGIKFLGGEDYLFRFCYEL